MADFPGSPTWQPRIVPTPPPKRGRSILAVGIGLLVGLLVFGTAGFFAGRATGGGGARPVAVTASPTPTASPTLASYEERQAQVNAAKFSGILTGFAASWTPYVTGCTKHTDQNGPKLNDGEDLRVLCAHGTFNVYFVQYKSAGERDKARLSRVAQNVDARDLTTDAAPPSQKTSTSGRVQGEYVEFALRSGEQVVTGLWWDDADTPVAGYILAFWKDGLGESWRPMRDLWLRHA